MDDKGFEPEAREARRIGLLFVHGIGEQARFDHLRSSVREVAELMRLTDPSASVTIVDRIGPDAERPIAPLAGEAAPISLDYRSDTQRVRFECREVWWGDLGARAGVMDSLAFWLWGLGQWCAPIHRELDPSRTSQAEKGGAIARAEAQRGAPVTRKLAFLPHSVVGRPREIWARIQLLLAAFAAAFIASTWWLAKRLLATLFGQAPSPTIIVQYVGDVRTYTARARPGDTPLSDPGHPRRVAIRRRMVGEMVAMAASGVERWYVLAHSLGTVVAYNGLTEIGHTLPNYLTEKQWEKAPAPWKRDPATIRRPDAEIARMMPARPAWLADEDVIDRRQLFARLRGFLTYGSPLDKFAGLWPRIVATAGDRTDGSPFPNDCEWINLYGLTDPVAGHLGCFEALDQGLPRPQNFAARWTPLVGLSHIRYFSGLERHRKLAGRQRLALMRWLFAPTLTLDKPPVGQTPSLRLRIPDHGDTPIKRIGASVLYLALLGLAWCVTALLALWSFGRTEGLAAHAAVALSGWGAFGAFVLAFVQALGIVSSFFLVPILAIGVWRWAAENWRNVALARADREAAPEPQRPSYDPLIRMLQSNVAAAVAMGAVGVILVKIGVWHDFGWTLAPLAWLPLGLATPLLCGLGFLLAIILQQAINARDP
jgi:hypothetical protein